MGVSEKNLLNSFLKEYSKLGSRLFRNNTGMGWTGITAGPIRELRKRVLLKQGDIVLKKARPFHAGFPKGSSDLIGWTQVEVTPDMVGKSVAIFTAIEVKTEKLVATREQDAFINTVNKAGGIGLIARELKDIIDRIAVYALKGDSDEA